MNSIQFFALEEETQDLLKIVAERLSFEVFGLGPREFEIRSNTLPMLKCNVGELKDEVLYESVLGSFHGSYPLGVTQSRTIRTTMRKFLHAGLWFVNPSEHTREFYKESFYSQGAADVAERGVKLLEFPGTSNFALIDKAASQRYRSVRGRVIERNFGAQ